MKLTAAEAKLLRATLRARAPTDLRRAFATIRAHDDRALLAAIKPVKKKKAKRPADPLVRDIELTLKPILGPSAEKADLLVEHIAKRRRRKLSIAPKGLADAAKQLRATFTDDQIRDAAKSLVAHLAKLYGDRETVV